MFLQVGVPSESANLNWAFHITATKWLEPLGTKHKLLSQKSLFFDSPSVSFEDECSRMGFFSLKISKSNLGKEINI